MRAWLLAGLVWAAGLTFVSEAGAGVIYGSSGRRSVIMPHRALIGPGWVMAAPAPGPYALRVSDA